MESSANAPPLSSAASISTTSSSSTTTTSPLPLTSSSLAPTTSTSATTTAPNSSSSSSSISTSINNHSSQQLPPQDATQQMAHTAAALTSAVNNNNSGLSANNLAAASGNNNITNNNNSSSSNNINNINNNNSNNSTNNAKSNDSSANSRHSEEPHDKAKSNDEHLPKRNPSEDLFSTDKWGVTPIRQDTPWELPPSPTQNSSGPSIGASSGVSLASTSAPTLPPGISQSGDSFRTGASINDFHAPAMVNNFGVDNTGANGLVNSLGHMNLGGNGGGSVGGGGGGGYSGGVASGMHSRFDQSWRAPVAKQNPTSMASASSFANHNLINPAAGMQKSMLNSGSGGSGGSSFVGMQQQQQGGEFARAPGPASSMMDNNMTPKPFGMANRSSTWSAFGSATPNESDSEWPKTTTSGISAGNSAQPSNAFDLVPEFDSNKGWAESMLIKGLDEDQPINSGPTGGIPSFAGYAGTSKSPTGSQYEPSGIGTWSPVVKGGRTGSKWDGDGPDNARSDNGFDDGTAIWGSTNTSKPAGVEWIDKSGGADANSNIHKSRTMAGNNQSYRPQQSSSSASLLMSSTTSPSSQQNRNQQAMKQPSLSQNFDQVQQQSNALSSQANQPNRGPGCSSNVPSTQQLKHMVQQIQVAVQAGHLNPQILNQPLAPVTLQLLYQLLQQIKVLQQLQSQASQQFNKPGNYPANVSVHITKTKQNILNLQNQIAAQQAVYLKQTQIQNISSRQQTMPHLAAGGLGGSMGPALPPGISQSGDSFRTGASINDFHAAAMVNNFGVDNMGANGLVNSLGHMNLGVGGGNGGGGMQSRFDQPWRAPVAKQNPTSMAPASPFANYNLINPAAGMQKSMLNSGAGGVGGGSSFVGMQQQQQGGEFARAPGPASSMMDNNMTPKPFGMANRSSTWSAFGSATPNESDSEWPKTTTSGISAGNSAQPATNAFDLVPEFEPGKPWRGSMLMKSVEDDPTMTPGSMARSLAPQRKTIWSDEIMWDKN